MKNIDYTYYLMFDFVNKTFERYKTIWEDNQIISKQIKILSDNINLIDASSTLSRNKTNSITVGKKSLRSKLEELGFMIKESLRLFYSMNNKAEDAKLLKYSRSVLTRMTDDSFYVEIKQISERADLLKTELLPFGITAEQLSELSIDLQEFFTIKPEREKLINNRAEHVKLIPEIVNETRLILRNIIDPLMLIYKEKQQSFYTEYKNARIRDERPGRKNRYTIWVKGEITDAVSLLPITGVVIVAGQKNKETLSDEKGIFKVKVYKKDADTIRFSKENYENLMMPIPKKYEKNEVHLHVEMKKTEQD
jgi:hypothetical protein